MEDYIAFGFAVLTLGSGCARFAQGLTCARLIARSAHIAGSRMTEGHLPRLIAGEIFDLRGGRKVANGSIWVKIGHSERP